MYAIDITIAMLCLNGSLTTTDRLPPEQLKTELLTVYVLKAVERLGSENFMFNVDLCKLLSTSHTTTYLQRMTLQNKSLVG